jgi:hypothetical protein
MDSKDRIYVAPKRGRLPRRYEFADRGPLTVKQQLRLAAVLLALCAGMSWLIYLVLK